MNAQCTKGIQRLERAEQISTQAVWATTVQALPHYSAWSGLGLA